MADAAEPFRVQSLTADQWLPISELRLEALKRHPDVYSSSYSTELAFGQNDWEAFIKPNGKCLFGLYRANLLIGITGIFTDLGDNSGATAIMGASYIRPAFRGLRLSRLLYRARLEWAIKNPAWGWVRVAHREGNEASRRANQKWGFVFVGKESMTWPDGSVADQYWYKLDLNEVRRAGDMDLG